MTRLDLWLLLMASIWGANYSVVKVALLEIPEHAFNAMRLVIASALFLIALALRGGLRLTRHDVARLLLLGVIGHFIYQLCFIAGLSRTSVANSALIIGCSPIAVALATAAAGHERVSLLHWSGVLLSVVGIYLVVGQGALAGHDSLLGDALMVGAISCWAIYTVGSRPLLAKLSPLTVTGYSMAFGTIMYLPFALPQLASLRMAAVSGCAWASVALSAIFALGVAYLIWYTAVQKIGNIRTSIYSNMVPVVALVVATLWLHERITVAKLWGAAAIIGGVGLTRLGSLSAAGPPAEE